MRRNGREARDFAMAFEPELVTNEFWKPVLERLAGGSAGVQAAAKALLAGQKALPSGPVA